LFCFPYAGGTAQIYRPWASSLPSTVEVYLINLPGRGMRLHERTFTQMSPMVQEIANVLLPVLDKPFAFFGHSMGALISFELAHHLRSENGLSPAQLFVSGRRAPQIPDTDPPTHELPDAEFIEELRRLNGTPKEVLEHPELMQIMLPVLRSDFAICQTYAYEPRPILDCPITAYGGLLDEDVSREQLEAWGKQTSALFKMRLLPGDHFFIHTAQSLLLEALTHELNLLARRLFYF
jgi:medium-chain acyl-[acyl-carrier-protein] hydrolase